LIRLDNLAADRQTQATARSVRLRRLGGELFENPLQIAGLNTRTGISYLDTKGVWPIRASRATVLMLHVLRHVFRSAVPERGTGLNFDAAMVRRKPAGIIQNIDQHLFNRRRLEQDRFSGRNRVDANGDRFGIGHGSNLVDRVIDAGPNVTRLRGKPAASLAAHTHLEHRGDETRKTAGAALHSFQNTHLFAIE